MKWLAMLWIVAACGPTQIDTPSGVQDAAVDSEVLADDGAELWYSIGNALVYVDLNTIGDVEDWRMFTLSPAQPAGYSSLTVLHDGALLGARLHSSDGLTSFFLIPEPRRDGDSTLEIVELGLMPESLKLEALYTDCDGRIYGMDTGDNQDDAIGNRLIRFTGNVTQGDFTYSVVSDLEVADVADIDDMSPGVIGDQITDNPGFALDTSDLYFFNYESGTGDLAANAGKWGIHALGGNYFSDGQARIYVLSDAGELQVVTPETYNVSPAIWIGPDVDGEPGKSGLAGPLSDCDTGFIE